MRDALGLADPLHALHGRLGVLCGGLSAYVPAVFCTVLTANRVSWSGSSAA